MTPLVSTFPAACLLFGIFCAVLAGFGYRNELRDEKKREEIRQAVIERVRFHVPPDERPYRLESTIPWKHRESWFGLSPNPVKAATREQGWTHPALEPGVEPTEVILAKKPGEAKS